MRSIFSVRIALIGLSLCVLASCSAVPPLRVHRAQQLDPPHIGPSGTGNFGPYDGPDFVVPESDIGS